MPNGIGLTQEQKNYILKNKDKKFMRQMAKELGICQRTVSLAIKKAER